MARSAAPSSVRAPCATHSPVMSRQHRRFVRPGAVLRELGLPDSERDAMLARYDRDGDHVITLNELNNLIADAMAAFSY